MSALQVLKNYTADIMLNKVYEKSKRFIMCGLLGLAAGSVLLLARKFSAVPAFWADLSVFAGGCIVLCSYSCIIYGLLIFAGNREKE